MVALAFAAKVVGLLAVLILSSSAVIFSGQPQNITLNSNDTNQTNITIPQNETVTFDDLKNDFPEFTMSFWEMLSAGIGGSAKFVSKVIVWGGNEILKYFEIPYSLPIWIGYAAFILIMVLFFLWQWENIWSVITHQFMLIIIILAVIFVLGIVLTMLGFA